MPTPIPKEDPDASPCEPEAVDDEPRCSSCGRPCGHFTRYDFLPPPRRARRRRRLPRDRPF